MRCHRIYEDGQDHLSEARAFAVMSARSFFPQHPTSIRSQRSTFKCIDALFDLLEEEFCGYDLIELKNAMGCAFVGLARALTANRPDYHDDAEGEREGETTPATAEPIIDAVINLAARRLPHVGIPEFTRAVGMAAIGLDCAASTDRCR